VTTKSNRDAGLTFSPLTLYTIQWVERLVAKHFGSPRVVSRGQLHQVRDLPGLIAVREGKQVGLAQYHIAHSKNEEADFEIVTLIAEERRTGVGRALLAATEPIARAAGCCRMWLVTTNNNEDGLAFYRAIGWRQVAIRTGAVDIARVLKPEIPTTDTAGRPIRDEIEFERLLF
jgi:GNAT superfamily N-acetyltransferase